METSRSHVTTLHTKSKPLPSTKRGYTPNRLTPKPNTLNPKSSWLTSEPLLKVKFFSLLILVNIQTQKVKVLRANQKNAKSYKSKSYNPKAQNSPKALHGMVFGHQKPQNLSP